MNPLYERYPDLVGEQDDAALLACVTDLDAACAALTLPVECDASVARSLNAQARDLQTATAVPRAKRSWLRPGWPVGGWRLVSVTLAALVALGGTGVYLHGAGPGPVNAQTILHRAAAVTPGPNEATHTTYRITASGGYSGTADVWVGTDAQGAVSEFALTGHMSLNGQPAPELISPRVMTNQEMQVYDPKTNTVTISSPPSPEDQQMEGLFVGALVAQTMKRCQAAVQQQTLDGVPVYAFRFEGSQQTLYFNRQSYVLEGSDWTENRPDWAKKGPEWHARLDPSSYQTMPLSSVPPHTFSLNAPPTARVERETFPQPASGNQGCSASR